VCTRAESEAGRLRDRVIIGHRYKWESSWAIMVFGPLDKQTRNKAAQATASSYKRDVSCSTCVCFPRGGGMEDNITTLLKRQPLSILQEMRGAG
jgi:hypothetical protein